MSEAATLARPYARAAFELARDSQAMDAWSSHLATAAAIAADPRMAGLGNDPQVEPQELARLHCPEGVDESAPFARYLGVMAENRRLSLLPEVASHFESLRRAAEHTVMVRLRCAEAPQPEQTEKLKDALKAKLDSKINLEIEVEPEMLGGAIIDIDGEVIDGSVRARLQQLQTALMR
ncbi:MAG: F0F1 ATP synthase subunit delta [Rhodanobacteraceae bacterium]